MLTLEECVGIIQVNSSGKVFMQHGSRSRSNKEIGISDTGRLVQPKEGRH